MNKFNTGNEHATISLRPAFAPESYIKFPNIKVDLGWDFAAPQSACYHPPLHLIGMDMVIFGLLLITVN